MNLIRLSGVPCVILLLLIVKEIATQDAQVSYHVREENRSQSLVGNAFVDSQLRSRIGSVSNIRFSFVSPTSQTKYFRIEEWSGAMHTTQPLDRETVCRVGPCPVNLDVAVQVVSGASLDLVHIIRVQVFVDDINDNAPSFPAPSVALPIMESTPVHTTFRVSAATDPDTAGNNSAISYELQPSGGLGRFGMSIINNWDGTTDIGIIVKQRLDREKVSFFQIQVVAKDGGSPQQTGTLTINISVTDSNDHAPVFTRPLYNITVQENVTIGTEILRLSTNDGDIGMNSQVVYSFNLRSAAKIGGIFKIHEATGAVTVGSSVDYETFRVYQLIVEARDHGVPPKSSRAALIINVLDVNDNPPDITFNLLAGGDHALVSEYAKNGSFVAHISVSDSDMATVNREISCWIHHNLFGLRKLSDQEFKVILLGKLDRERTAKYTIDVICKDYGEPSLEATTTLDVIVKDENDHAPIFTQKNYSTTISENFPVGKSILKVLAEDGDVGRNSLVTYELGRNKHPNLTIHSGTGVLIASGVLDREQTPVIELQVLARDNGSPRHTATTGITITLEDINDVPPIFSQETYNFHVPENLPADTRVGNVTVTDPDLGAGGKVFYTLIKTTGPTGAFEVSPIDGSIKTKQTFDREFLNMYTLVIMATDKGIPSLSRRVDVVVEILDENDHYPVITYPIGENNTVEILHSLEPDSLVAHIQARDKDSGDNSRLSFFIQSGDRERFLKMNKDNGEIRIAKPIRRYLAGTYNLIIGVKDNGIPAKSSWKPLHLTVLIDNATTVPTTTDDANTNMAIVISVVTATFILSMAIIVGIFIIRRNDTKKHNYRTKLEERKIIRRKGSNASNSRSDQSHSTTSSSDLTKKDVSLTLTDDSQAPLNTSSFTQVTSFSTFKGQMLSYISSIDQKTLECPQACSSWITNNTASPENKVDAVGDKRAEINKLAYGPGSQLVSPHDRPYLQIIHEETETKSMIKALNDTLSDVSSETMVTSDSGRGGSEEDVHLKAFGVNDKQGDLKSHQGNGRVLSSFGDYKQRQCERYVGHSRDNFTRKSGYRDNVQTTNKLYGTNYEKNINCSDGSITDNTTVRNSEPPPRPPRSYHHKTPTEQIVDLPSAVHSYLPTAQDSHMPPGFLSRLHMKSPSAQMCSPSLAGKSAYYPGDTFRSMDTRTMTIYDATTTSEHGGCAYSVGDIDDVESECATDFKDDATTTSGSYTINPDELCNEIDELFFRDIIV